MESIEREVEESYGFLPDSSTSLTKDAQRVLGDMPSGYYFQNPYKLAFHDLTPGKSLPPATRIIMGLGTKFIPVPRQAPTRKKVMEAFERFHRDLDLKVFFAGSDSCFESKTKLYVKSTFRPFSIPIEIDSRLYRFEIELR